ncbi:MAG: beta-L-arabinofuranosidase domain-containing protein [Terracidiphilus sp.]
MSQSRRTFLKTGAALAAASLAKARIASAVSSAQAAGPAPLDQFDYGDVQLMEGPMLRQFENNHVLFLAIDEDMLLKPFRLRAGMPAPGEDMGGWYDDSLDFDPHGDFHGFIPGHSFGQYLSGLARAYAVTGSKPTQEKVHRLVRAFAPTITTKFYDGYHLPAYTFDKTNCGLIDAHQFAGDASALEVLNAATDAVLPHLPPKAMSRSEQYAQPHPDEAYCWDETYTLPENFFLAYQRGAGSRYRDLAVRFLEDDLYFGPLAEGQNVLPGEHAYSHVNALSSAMQAYLVLGSETHLRAARNGFAFVRDTQSFATGGWGPDETFRKPGSGGMGESLSRSHASFETPCGAYGHFKITRYLLRVTGDSRYGDSMERVLYNTILGARPLKEDGTSFYYSDYNNRFAKKGFHRDKWPCCSGTFPQIAADYGISSYFHDRDGVYVNLYVPSRVSWTENGARFALTQKTDYPHRPESEIEVSAGKPGAFAVSLRIPAWAGPGTTVAVNGQRILAGPDPGKFARLDRTWANGDRIEIEFDMPANLEAIDPEHPDLQALVHGPLALFGVGAAPAAMNKKDLLAAAQVSTGSTDWQAKTATGALTLRPFAAIGDELYRLYLNVES